MQAGLWKAGLSNETNWIPIAAKQQDGWYKGDGAYGDGDFFHWDHYNSLVMHPMVVDAVSVAREIPGLEEIGSKYDCFLARMQRYGVVQERMIHADGSYLNVGRSAHYRFGAFQALSQLALQKNLPKNLPPAQVRTALTGVIKRFLANPKNFVKEGWLAAGVNGHQPRMMNGYGDTGALYLTSVGLLHLGLPETDPFWTDPAIPCTQEQIWELGVDVGLDEAIDGPSACFEKSQEFS